MKNFSQYIIVALFGLLLITSGCKEDEHELGALIAPTNVDFTFEIVGVDNENSYGDGSGFVNFSATGDNAITFNYNFDDGRDIEIAADGNITHQFAITGVNTYNVTVNAVGTGGLITSKTTPVEVLSNFEDEEALEFLTGGSSKAWYWAADQPGHAGMGTESEDYGNLDYTWASWWQIGPFDEDKACMYNAEFVFTKEANGLTFEQTTGLAWIPATYADKIGVQGDMCYGDDVATPLYGVKNVTFVPSSSKASIDGEYRGTTMTISDDGFMCWWVGNSEYDIIEVTENTLKVRVKEDDVQAWYHTFSSVKPEQK